MRRTLGTQGWGSNRRGSGQYLRWSSRVFASENARQVNSVVAPGVRRVEGSRWVATSVRLRPEVDSCDRQVAFLTLEPAARKAFCDTSELFGPLSGLEGRRTHSEICCHGPEDREEFGAPNACCDADIQRRLPASLAGLAAIAEVGSYEYRVAVG